MDVKICLFSLLLVTVFILAYGDPTPTPTPSPPCTSYSNSCDECVKHAKCIYCNAGKYCMDYPKKNIIPRVDGCDLSELRWGTCVVNYKALLITMGTIAGILLLSCSGCIVYCCWCRGPSGRQKRKWAKEDASQDRKKEERQMKQDQRKTDRQARNDEIRRKYGLKKDDDGQYHQLDED